MKTLAIRKRAHIASVNKGSRLLFHRAIRKHGMENFSWEIVDNCLFAESLIVLEKHYIKLFNSKSPHGYNLTDGGDGILNPSIELRARMSHSQHGRIFTAETRAKMSAVRTGKKLSDETKKKLSIINTGENHPRYGKHHSAESRKKISISNKGKKRRPLSAEHKAKLSLAGRNPSVSARLKMSEAAKNYWRQYRVVN